MRSKNIVVSAYFNPRYSLIHVLTYGMLIIPSLGYIICENQLESLLVVSKIDLDLHNSTTNSIDKTDGIEMISTYAFCEPDHLFFPRPLWQYMLLLFATFRVAYPFILIKSDSYLRQKINFIVRYFVGSYNTNSYSRKMIDTYNFQVYSVNNVL